MKIKLFILSAAMLGVLFSSCIKEEGQFREADMVSIELDMDEYKTTLFSTDGDNSVQLLVATTADYSSLSPIIAISDGAIVSPASGVAQDFSEGKEVLYTISSQDGAHTQTYRVSVISSLSLKLDFESWKKHVMGYPVYNDPAWDSANNGVRWGGGNREEYPTRPTTDAYKGTTALLLETQMGVNGGMAGHKPIFPGSFFRGKFALNTTNHIRSAKFGVIQPKELGMPMYMTGRYKYKSGPEYREFVDDETRPIAGKLDELDLYAVVYKIPKGSDKTEFVYGDNIHTASNIIGRATLEDRSEKSEYTKFKVSFVYTEKMDFSENSEYDYKLAVVMSSSKRGDYFEGSIGSTLIVDELEVVCRID